MQHALIVVTLAFVLPLAGNPGRVRTPPPSATQPFHPTSPAEQSWLDLYREAYALDRAGKYREAATLLEAGAALARTARCATCELRSLANLGAARLAASMHREALDAFLSARRLAERIGDRETSGVLSMNLSNLYIHRYAYEEAAAATEQAMAALAGSSQPWIRNKVLIQKARLAARQNDMDAAARLYREAVAEASRTGDSASEAMAWEHLGLGHLRRSELRPAEDALIESFRLRRVRNDRTLAASYHSLAWLRLEQGDAASALRLADRANEEWSRGTPGRPRWQLLLTRGRALAALGRSEQAIAEFDRALEHIRAQRADALPADAFRVSYGAGTQEVYASRIETGNRVALDRRTPGPLARRLIQEGLALAEESRSLSLRQSGGEWEAVRRKLPPGYYDVLSRLQSAHAAVQLRDSAEARREMESARLRLVELEASAGLDYEGASQRVRAFRTSDLGAGQALFTFYLGERESYVWSATREGLDLARLPSRADLAARIAAFAAGIRANRGDAIEQGELLFRTLFGSVSPAVQARRQWLLSLDGELFDLPFAALIKERRGGDPVHLVREHSVQMLPGAWSLSGGVAAAWSGPLLALGDPVYNVADRRWTGAARARVEPGAELPRLAGSAREVRACLRAWGGDGLVLDGMDAGWDELRRALERTRPEALHLATHYVESPETPRQVLLALGLSRGGDWQYLGPEQIASLRLATRLVVLSGCGSGNGRDVAGEGRIGLARAFLKSGARSVAATYWPTPDESGALVEAFYRQWRSLRQVNSPAPPAEALRMAQLEMIRGGSWKAEPRYWASYFVIGES